MPKVSFFILLSFLIVGFSSCVNHSGSDTDEKIYVFGGPAQGTTYRVKYHGANLADHQESIDSILEVIDLSLSTYVESSTISRFNRQRELVTNDPHFVRMLFDAKDLRDMSEGAFEPAVMPLVKAWGFGPDGPQLEDSVNVDSLLKLVNWDFELKISNQAEAGSDRLTTVEIVKNRPVEFDFNGVAQGYTVDVVVEFLNRRGVKNLMVEIGGEVRAVGVNETGDPWLIGIDQPNENGERGSQARLKLENQSVATSGNYRKFYEKDGKRLSHTINPKTGRPVSHQLLSATVVASTCAMADAFATVFMVYGPEKSMAFLESDKANGLEAYLIYHDDSGELKTFMSEGLKGQIEETADLNDLSGA